MSLVLCLRIYFQLFKNTQNSLSIFVPVSGFSKCFWETNKACCDFKIHQIYFHTSRCTLDWDIHLRNLVNIKMTARKYQAGATCSMECCKTGLNPTNSSGGFPQERKKERGSYTKEGTGNNKNTRTPSGVWETENIIKAMGRRTMQMMKCERAKYTIWNLFRL